MSFLYSRHTSEVQGSRKAGLPLAGDRHRPGAPEGANGWLPGMRKDKCVSTASSTRWRREILQRFREKPPSPQNEQELDVSGRKSGRDYQAVRYSEASEERFLELMKKRKAVEAEFPAEPELFCLAERERDRERERERGCKCLPIKQEGIFPGAQELQDLEFEELDRRASEVLKKSVQVLQGSTFAYLGIGRRHVDVEGTRKTSAQTPPTAAGRAAQEEDDMAATALSAAMNFLVHSVQDGAFLDEWLVSGTTAQRKVVNQPIQVCSFGASPNTASDASIPFKDAHGRRTGPSCVGGISFLQEDSTNSALVPYQAHGHSRTSKGVTSVPDVATSSVVAADSCYPVSDVPLSPAVDNLIFQVIHEWLSPDDQQDLTLRGRQGNLGKSDETYVHREPSPTSAFAAAGHPDKQRDEVMLSSLPSRSWPLDESALKTPDDQPPDLDTVNYLDDIETSNY